MKKWKVIVGIVLLFLLGMATGALVTHRAYKRAFDKFTEGPSSARYAIVKVLTRRLDLTPAQQAEVDDAIRDAQNEFQLIRQELHPRVETIFDRAKERIRDKLDVEQRKEFERIVEQHRKRWRNRMK